MKSKLVFLISLSLITTSALAQFKDPDQNKLAQFKSPNEQLAQFQSSDKGKNDQQQTQNSNGEIIAFLMTVDKNEIAVSDEALKKNLSPMIKDYAMMLNKDHSNNLKATEILSNKINQKPENTAMTNSLKEKGKQVLSKLKSLNNTQFDNVFIEDMVKGHQEALNAIDENLNKTSNPELKQLLIDTRATVSMHLQKAKEIQDKLKTTH